LFVEKVRVIKRSFLKQQQQHSKAKQTNNKMQENEKKFEYKKGLFFDARDDHQQTNQQL
jgi:hypothetical protein